MRDQTCIDEVFDSEWKSLCRISGTAALLAGIIFRRNLGVEIALFSAVKPPTTPEDWLRLLQNHRLLGLAYLSIFDLVNAVLVGLMLLGLYIVFRRVYPGCSMVAVFLGFLGVAVCLSSNTALSMLSLSDQYAALTSEAQRAGLLPAAQALLALNRFSVPGANPGSGGFLSLLLVAAAGLIFSTMLLRGSRFGRWAAFVGILANSLDLIYCLAFPFTQGASHDMLAMLFIPAAGFFLMVWHFLVGVWLLNLTKLFKRQRWITRPVEMQTD